MKGPDDQATSFIGCGKFCWENVWVLQHKYTNTCTAGRSEHSESTIQVMGTLLEIIIATTKTQGTFKTAHSLSPSPHTHVHTHLGAHTCAHTHTHTHIHTHTHTHTHTHEHACTHSHANTLTPTHPPKNPPHLHAYNFTHQCVYTHTQNT